MWETALQKPNVMSSVLRLFAQTCGTRRSKKKKKKVKHRDGDDDTFGNDDDSEGEFGSDDNTTSKTNSENASKGISGSRFDQSTRLEPMQNAPPLRKLGGFVSDEKKKKKKKKKKKTWKKKGKSSDVVEFVSGFEDEEL